MYYKTAREEIAKRLTGIGACHGAIKRVCESDYASEQDAWDRHEDAYDMMWLLAWCAYDEHNPKAKGMLLLFEAFQGVATALGVEDVRQSDDDDLRAYVTALFDEGKSTIDSFAASMTRRSGVDWNRVDRITFACSVSDALSTLSFCRRDCTVFGAKIIREVVPECPLSSVARNPR